MQRISSGTTFLSKGLFPVAVFAPIALVLVIGVLVPPGKGESPSLFVGFFIRFLVVLVIVATIRYLVVRRAAFGLVDEVFDAGNALIVRKSGIDDQIPLSDIINVSYSVGVTYSRYNNPTHVTLMLRTPSRFGDRVTFLAPAQFVRFSLAELIWRIDAARRGRRA